MYAVIAASIYLSMILFAEIEEYASVLGKVIDKYYDGRKDENTIRLSLESEET